MSKQKNSDNWRSVTLNLDHSPRKVKADRTGVPYQSIVLKEAEASKNERKLTLTNTDHVVQLAYNFKKGAYKMVPYDTTDYITKCEEAYAKYDLETDWFDESQTPSQRPKMVKSKKNLKDSSISIKNYLLHKKIKRTARVSRNKRDTKADLLEAND